MKQTVAARVGIRNRPALRTGRSWFWPCLGMAALLAACQAEPPAGVVAAARAAPDPGPQEAAVPLEGSEPAGRIHPQRWPEIAPLPADPAVEARVDELLAGMSLRDKVGQIIQADLAQITPQEMREYRLGSVLQGGNTGPAGKQWGTVAEWVAALDEIWVAAMSPRDDGGPLIPPVIGIDAVHGHNNVIGGTIFPHNIGLGAANNPQLIREIAEVTARELVITGHDWTFAPTLAVVRNDRWGRAYEGYSEAPDIVAAYAPEIVRGLQGTPGEADYFSDDKVISTAKHFVGDGGTTDGRDTGNNEMSEAELRDNQAAGYVPAVEAGVSSVMASFSSWHGVRMHGHRPLLTDVLKGRWNFRGFVVGDWNGHGLVAGCSDTSCARAVQSGIDMFMAPDSWKALFHATLAQVESGEISEARLDDAVRRILRVKVESGLMDKPRPSERPLVGDASKLGSGEHRAVARRAVRESLVLLKNNGVLPLAPQARILLAGDGADSIGKVSGGWTLSWQGGEFERALFPNGISIYEAMREAVADAGGVVELSVDGSFAERPDVAVVVFGEEPYAEFIGDREHVGYDVRGEGEVRLLRRLQEAGIPVVSVFISGRPMWVNPELNASEAFVAAWLPGSEGSGVADVLIADAQGEPRYDFSGRLSFSWPATPLQVEVNVGDPDYQPLFPYGYGLSYAASGEVGPLDERAGVEGLADTDVLSFYDRGKVPAPWAMYVSEGGAEWAAVGRETRQAFTGLSLDRIDHRAQEDAWRLTWSGDTAAALLIADLDASHAYQQQAHGDMELVLNYRLEQAPEAAISIGWGCAAVDQACLARLPLNPLLADAAVGEWRTLRVALKCFQAAGANMRKTNIPFFLHSEGPAAIAFSRVYLDADDDGQRECPSAEGGSE